MNLLSLRYFVEVAKTLNFTKASKNLFISQPGISQQIHLLEDQLGVKLLQRTTRRVELTPEGEYLFKETCSSLEKIEKTVNHLKDSQKFSPHLKIAMIPSVASLYLSKLIEEFNSSYSHIKLYFHEATTSEVLRLIDNYTFHFGIIRLPIKDLIKRDYHYNYLKVASSKVKAIVSKNHRFASNRTINLLDLKDEKFIHFSAEKSPALHHLLEKACQSASIQPNILFHSTDLFALENIIANNLAVTILPEDIFVQIDSPNIIALDIADLQLESPTVAVWKDKGNARRNEEIFLEVIGKLREPISV